MQFKFFTKSLAAALLLLLSFNFSFAHWSTRGPYGGHVTAFTTLDTITFLGSSNGGVYRATNTQFTNWVYRNYTGLGSGKITSLTTIGRKVLAATADSGVYISNDLGLTWSPANNGITNLQVLSLATSYNGKIYAGTNGGGIFQSVDSGATWVAKSTGLTSQIVTTFVTLGDTVLAGTQGGGVNVTITGGNAWLTLNNGLTDFNVTSLAFSLTGVAFVGTPSGVFKGNLVTFTWALANTGLTNTRVNALYLTGSDLYAATNAGVFTSPIANVSWGAVGSYVDTVKALNIYNNTLLAGTKNNGVQKVNLSTLNWSAANAGFNNLQSYAGAAKDSTVVIANEQGVFVCKNFVASSVYVPSNTGLTDSLHVNALQINAAHTIYAGTQNAGVFVSADSGATWVSANTGLTNLSVVKLLAGGTKLFAATANGKIFSTLQSAINWAEFGTGIPANTVITSLAYLGSDTLVAGTTTGLYFTPDGVNWDNPGLTEQVNAVAFKEGNLYIGTDTSGVIKISLANPSPVFVNNNLPTKRITALYSVDKFVVVGYKGGAKATCNGAKTWKDFEILEYIPNYGDIIGFTDITPRIFALVPQHGLLGNGKIEYPDGTPDTISALTGLTEVCAGSAAAYSVVNDEDANTYTWTFPANWTNIAVNGNLATATADNSTGGNITVTATNGCGSSTKSFPVTVAPIPTVSLALTQATVCSTSAPIALAGGTPAGGTYSGQGVTSGNFNPAQAFLGNVVITYSYTSPAGCTSQAIDTLTNTACSGINEVNNAGVQVFPNPFSNQLTVKTEGLAGSYIVVSDVTGKTVTTVGITGSNTGINTTDFANGIYTVSVIANGQKVAAAKLVKAE